MSGLYATTQEPLPELLLDPELPLPPAPEFVSEVSLGAELPLLPASPPEPGRAVPFLFAPLVPLGLEEPSASVDLASDEDLAPLMLLSWVVSVMLVAAITGAQSTQASPAMVSASRRFLFIGEASWSKTTGVPRRAASPVSLRL